MNFKERRTWRRILMMNNFIIYQGVMIIIISVLMITNLINKIL